MSSLPNPDLSWAVPVMRMGYAGRGLVYLTVAGFSLYAIWRGGRAEGTSSALADLENTTGGGIVLALIFIGMLAYAAWRVLDAIFDLDDHGGDAKGIAARVAIALTGLFHLSIAGIAFSLLFAGGGSGDGSDGSSLRSALSALMQWPGGRWVAAAAGLAVLGAAGYFFVKGWKQTYRRHLVANHFTTHWNGALRAGLFAHGAVVAIVGGLILYAAWAADPNAAGGTREALSWLTGQPYGRILVAAVCVGLVGFALFCFVNAVWRIVPKVAGDTLETLAARLQAKARAAM
ncbi:DUF1206 domain-containing protein [Aquibium microcysteis]|uniref:DUF1206 domain-containing protein n=1 Tax=Aquibium microcysteis TaxID=675281 RepID=UPI001EF3BAA5|nr:DUF1206 domain-containing protein [Aquibium microcysteis]